MGEDQRVIAPSLDDTVWEGLFADTTQFYADEEHGTKNRTNHSATLL